MTDAVIDRRRREQEEFRRWLNAAIGVEAKPADRLSMAHSFRAVLRGEGSPVIVCGGFHKSLC